MNKELALKIMLLLSALESWGFSNGKELPDYMHDDLRNMIDELGKVVLE